MDVMWLVNSPSDLLSDGVSIGSLYFPGAERERGKFHSGRLFARKSGVLETTLKFHEPAAAADSGMRL